MQRITLPKRNNWRKKIEEFGLLRYDDSQSYWCEGAAYSLTLEEIEQKIEVPVQELNRLVLKLLDKLIYDDAYFKRLNIPTHLWDYIRASYQHQEPTLYGRYDFLMNEQGNIKLLEFNADTPTMLFESAVVQWFWLEEHLAAGTLPQGTDQFNSLHEKLIERFKVFNAEPQMAFTGLLDEPDDALTLNYLKECAEKAGLETKLLSIQDIGLKGKLFIDSEDNPLKNVFKLYPYEWMMFEEFSKALPSSQTRFIEPAWKILLSNKALLPHLWRAYPNHPLLLPSYFDNEKPSSFSNYVKKPIYSREGANVSIYHNNELIEQTAGDYGKEGFVVQDYCKSQDFNGFTPTLGIWVIGEEIAGMGIREQMNSKIVGKGAAFTPHFIEAL